MHTFERRSPAERARHINALRERSPGLLGDAGSFIKRQLARAILPLPSPTTTPAAKKTVTTTVIVKATAPPTTTNPLQIPKAVSLPTTTHTTSPLVPLDPLPTISPTSAIPTTPPAAIPVVPTSSPSPSPAIPTNTPPTSFPPLTTSSPIPTSTGAPGSGISSSSAKSKGISPAATVAIVALCVVAVLIVGIFGVRKVYMRRRERRRNTWGAGMFPVFPEKLESTPAQETAQPNSEKPSSPGPSSITSGSGFGAALSARDGPNQPMNANVPYYVTPAPPPMSYNNPMMEDVYGGLAAPGPSEAAKVAGFSAGNASAAAGGAVETAVVRVVFIPSLPDELSISVGEVVRLNKAFDDGWALCTNARGEQGVVPLECLDRTPQNTSSGGYGQGAAVDARRLSSLSSQGARY